MSGQSLAGYWRPSVEALLEAGRGRSGSTGSSPYLTVWRLYFGRSLARRIGRVPKSDGGSHNPQAQSGPLALHSALLLARGLLLRLQLVAG